MTKRKAKSRPKAKAKAGTRAKAKAKARPTTPAKAATAVSGPQRASKRITVSLPMLVRGRDVNDRLFEDTSESYNLSRDGASFLTRRELRLGQQVELVVRRRVAGPGAHDFETTGDVLRIVPHGAGEWEVGVHFTGPRFRTYMPETA
jgi:hypothetical protein